jgi:NADPH-dependent curcumin reductase CurA
MSEVWVLERVMDYKKERFEESLNGVDIVLDTVGGETQERSLRVLSYHLFLRQHKNVMAFEQRTSTWM